MTLEMEKEGKHVLGSVSSLLACLFILSDGVEFIPNGTIGYCREPAIIYFHDCLEKACLSCYFLRLTKGKYGYELTIDGVNLSKSKGGSLEIFKAEKQARFS